MDDRKKVDIADVARGCLYGGAIGDALGYPVEFFSYERIKAAYGEGGITSLRLSDGKALVSDDTQMTLFTVEALALFAVGKGSVEECGAAAYADWLATQRKGRPVPGNTPLAERAAMYVCRAPGNTCLSALESGVTGTVDKPINGSKGCGGVMRVAPCGVAEKLLGGAEGAAVAAAKLAAITHGHPLGWLSAAQLAYIVARAAQGESDIKRAVTDSFAALEKTFGGGRHVKRQNELTLAACDLAGRDMPDERAIASLGQGWVGEEALAIAVYCALKYEREPVKALIVAVNHSGDSDSTGAIAGNILGAFRGMGAWRAEDVDALDLKEEIGMEAEKLAFVSA